ncbi:MAG: Type 2 DNA topoisomerase 6 subunit B [Methanomassiliicoccales archaeon PtaB.Bin134]|nr:MAG: Type 2 DNA topoisomerase 6 subunit B [Methanomassiliicoccales archaeon PtaB.Bin134]
MASVADELAKKQKEISVSEFFERNRHILGFDSQVKSLIMGIKEAVDNSLDACEEANILPEIAVTVERVDKDEFRVTVEDNGPGIVKKMIPNVFGRLLYGSRFHAVRQSRGQQGIGISATVMYGQITTGKPATVVSKTGKEDVAWRMDIMVNTKKNMPDVLKEDPFVWDGKEQGTRITYHINGRYVSGKQSVMEYLRQTAIVNPHARITFTDPDGRRTTFERATDKMPPATKEIKPHPQGLELGTLMNMAKDTRNKTLGKFLQLDFSRISDRLAKEITDKAGLNMELNPAKLSLEDHKRLLAAIGEVKIMAPPTDCLSPIGSQLIKKGLRNVLDEVRPEFYAPPVTRDPKVHSGNPFLVEVGIVYGGGLPKDQTVQILRFANRVPLLYQQGACVITKAIENTDWRRYGLEQRGGSGIPFGPAIIMVHVASTKVPFTSEAKEAIANLPEVQAEIELALKICGRSLKTHLNKRETKSKTRVKFEIVQEILPLIAQKSAKIVGKPVPKLSGSITKIMNVVWVDDTVTFEKGRHKVRVSIYNYTPQAQRFNLHMVLPPGAFDYQGLQFFPTEVREDGKASWELPKIASTDRLDLMFHLKGLNKDDYDENEIYASGINPVFIIGAEPLPGDWDLKGLQVTESLEPPVQEEEEDEVDYDESTEALNDD